MQLILLGTPCGGMPEVARLLNRMGCYFGPENLASARAGQDFGERPDVRLANAAVLESLDCDALRIADFSLEKVGPATKSAFAEAAAGIVLNLDARRPWLISDDQLGLLLPLWQAVLEMPVVIFISRHPLEVGKALAQRKKISVEYGIALWEASTLHALRNPRSLPRVFVQLERLQTHPAQEAERILSELENFGVRGLQMPLEAEIATEAAPAESDNHLLNPQQERLWQALRDGSVADWQDFPALSAAAADLLHREEASLRQNAERRQIAALQEKVTLLEETLRQSGVEKQQQIEDLTQELEQRNRKVREQFQVLEQKNRKLHEQAALLLVKEAQRKKLLEEEGQNRLVLAESKTAVRAEVTAIFAQTIEAHREQIEKQGVAVAGKNQKIEELTENIKRKDARQQALTGQVVQANHRLAETKTALKTAAESHQQQLEAQQQLLAAKNKELFARRQALLEQEAQSRSKLLAAEAKTATVRNRSIVCERALKAAEASLNDLRQQFAGYEAGAEEQQKNDQALIARLEQSAAQASKKAGELRRTLENKMRENRLLKESVKKLQTGVKEIGRELERMQRSSRWRYGGYLLFRPAAGEPASADARILDSHKVWFQAEQTALLESALPVVVPDPPQPARPAKVAAKPALRSQTPSETPAAIPAPPPQLAVRPQDPPVIPLAALKVDIVICIYNALEDVRRCLESLLEHPTPLLRQLILVNDGSDEATTEYLRLVAKSGALPIALLESAEATGYTRAANRGLKITTGDYVVLLNSDTIVTPRWLDRLLACGESAPEIGIVGPLSNAASWQSVPERSSPAGDWLVNELPPGLALDRLAMLFTRERSPAYPRVPLVNGFCFAIKRVVLATVGLLDEAAFPRGYGEENDFCLRAGQAGFQLALADDCYVFHAKSKSYSHETRRELAKASGLVLKERYGAKLPAATDLLRDLPALQEARTAFQRVLDGPQTLTILFLANFRGAGGGVHSIMQEADGMRKMGALVQVAIRAADEEFYRGRYPGLPPDLFHVYQRHEDLAWQARAFEFVVATLFTGVRILREIMDVARDITPCYYIQDYEPRFFDPRQAYYQESIDSYSLIPMIRCFAKTRWLADTIRRNHPVEVYQVRPSIDREIYYPDDTAKPGQPFVVCAMVRPGTERRSPKLTFEVLRLLKQTYGERVEIEIFGVEAGDDFFSVQTSDFAYAVRGILKRQEVADLLRRSSLFIDASTYQAFGRTGLEAMACRCATILPADCGTSEYAIDGSNTLLVDPTSAEIIFAAARRYLDDENFYRNVIAAGLETSRNYSVEDACRSEIAFFSSLRSHPSPAIEEIAPALS